MSSFGMLACHACKNKTSLFTEIIVKYNAVLNAIILELREHTKGNLKYLIFNYQRNIIVLLTLNSLNKHIITVLLIVHFILV